MLPQPIMGQLCGSRLPNECKTRTGKELVVSIIQKCLTPIERGVDLRTKMVVRLPCPFGRATCNMSSTLMLYLTVKTDVVRCESGGEPIGEGMNLANLITDVISMNHQILHRGVLTRLCDATESFPLIGRRDLAIKLSPTSPLATVSIGCV